MFFCDERYVDLTHPDSNYKAIHDGLLATLPDIKPSQVFALDISQPSVAQAATKYEDEMKKVFLDASVLPSFDLLVLGMLLQYK